MLLLFTGLLQPLAVPPIPNCMHLPWLAPAGQALTDAVQIKLRQFLGADYVDRSLAQVGLGRCWVLDCGCWRARPSGLPPQLQLRCCTLPLTACKLAPSPPAADSIRDARTPCGAVCGGNAGPQDGAAAGGWRLVRRAPAAWPAGCCMLQSSGTPCHRRRAPPQRAHVLCLPACSCAQVADNLVEFLGEVDAKELASW